VTSEAADEPAFHRLHERIVHKGHIWHVSVAEFEGPNGERFERDVVRSPGSVGVVPVLFDAEGNASVVLVRQYRPVLDRWLLEIPAGMRDVDGEPPEETARRELQEEAGLTAGEVVPLITFEPSGGMTDSVCTVYLATHLEAAPDERHGPEEQAMEREVLPFAEAVRQAVSGEITDAKTVIGLLLAERRLAAGDGKPR
jgi:8-oxo-dGDP phosphatase